VSVALMFLGGALDLIDRAQRKDPQDLNAVELREAGLTLAREVSRLQGELDRAKPTQGSRVAGRPLVECMELVACGITLAIVQCMLVQDSISSRTLVGCLGDMSGRISAGCRVSSTLAFQGLTGRSAARSPTGLGSRGLRSLNASAADLSFGATFR